MGQSVSVAHRFGPCGEHSARFRISTSRLANAATREQPIAMATGQAAGTLAALAIQKHVPPRDVPVDQVQSALKKAGAVVGLQP